LRGKIKRKKIGGWERVSEGKKGRNSSDHKKKSKKKTAEEREVRISAGMGRDEGVKGELRGVYGEKKTGRDKGPQADERPNWDRKGAGGCDTAKKKRGRTQIGAGLSKSLDRKK